ncbi:MAG: hypothetical protein N4A48_06450 [Tepidibacter sp.]|jgi:hypothetical protein|uniref:TolB family protein n=1 Tax=Tepidibacter sp. TaxID=2529387 RepID=UPI0025F279EE|nr:hypothetical protein [Tepidibacter sp.]MCT4508391.1 hypothetical protein [Tepidibacter sp.]
MDKRDFFSLVSSQETINLAENMPDIKEFISIIIEPNIIHSKIINTISGISDEGQHLYGKKMVLHIKLKQKLLYLSDTQDYSIHTIENEYLQSTYIVIPPSIEGSSIEDLLKFNYLKNNIKIQDFTIKLINNRCIYKNVFLYIHTHFIPSYELIYSLHNKSTESNIFISYSDCSKDKKIVSYNNSKNIRPTWSPNGDKIAFLSNKENNNLKYMLYIHYIKDSIIRKLITPDEIPSITSFCWTTDGQNLIFSGSYRNQKNLFYIDINTSKCKQLTFGSNTIKNYKPKVCPTEKKVAFLQSISGISNLCIMNIGKMNINKITSSGYIKDFNWSKDGNFISYIYGKSDICDKIYTLNLINFETKLLKIPKQIIKIKNIQYSNCNNFIAFIGSDLITDNIYIYNIPKDCFVNLTNNIFNIKINDFIWKIDSSSIYYSAKEFKYFNICSISLSDYSKYTLTNTTACDIELNYRPKIV